MVSFNKAFSGQYEDLPTACRYSNQTGVDVRPMDWGGLGGVQSLDPSLPQITQVYKSLTEGLKKAGYAERVDLFGAPYDFRLAADGLEQVPIVMLDNCAERYQAWLDRASYVCLLIMVASHRRKSDKLLDCVHAGWVLSESDKSGGARRGSQ